MRTIPAIALMTILGITASAHSQASQRTRQPSSELRELQGYFAGNWELTGETKTSPFAPGGQKFTSTERLEEMPGGFFLVAHSYDRNKWVGLTIIAYDENAKEFTHTTYSATGKVEVMKGTAQGDTLTWYQDGKVQGKPVKERMTIKKVSPVLYTFKFEIAPEQGDWSLVYEGKGNRQK